MGYFSHDEGSVFVVFVWVVIRYDEVSSVK